VLRKGYGTQSCDRSGDSVRMGEGRPLRRRCSSGAGGGGDKLILWRLTSKREKGEDLPENTTRVNRWPVYKPISGAKGPQEKDNYFRKKKKLKESTSERKKREHEALDIDGRSTIPKRTAGRHREPH